MGKIDRRILRTRHNLQQSLVDLILEKGYEAISVQAITERAKLGRATFYLHYHDKDDLLFKTLDLGVEELLDEIEQIPVSDWKKSRIQPFLSTLKRVSENEKFLQILFSNNEGAKVTDYLHKKIYIAIHQFIENQNEAGIIHPNMPVDFIANYYTSILLCMMAWWIKNNSPYEVDELISMLDRVISQGLDSIMGVNPQ